MPSEKRSHKKPGVKAATILAVVLLIFAVIGIRMGTPGVISPFKYLFLDVSGHFQNVLSSPIKWSRELWDSYVALQNLKVENRALREEITRLQQELTRYREALIASERLKRLLKLKKQVSGPLLAANVIGVDLAPWAATVTVDLGKKEGVEPGMVALAGSGVAGHIIDSSFMFSKILLLSDTKSAVAALIQRNRVRGILKGSGDWMCSLDYVEKGVDVQVGDAIITSGTDGIFPKGLLLGNVVKVAPGTPSDLFQEIQVKPAADLKRLEEVVILMESRPLAGGRP